MSADQIFVIYQFASSSSPDTVILLSTLDNLIKGSSGQAIQNANLMFNLDESLGLLTPPIYP